MPVISAVELMSDEELRRKCAVPNPTTGPRGQVIGGQVRCGICIFCEEWYKRQKRQKTRPG